MSISKLAGVAALAMALSGCGMLVHRTLASGIDTQIVDARTGAPVAGAKVTLRPGEGETDGGIRTMTTGPDGRVRIDTIHTTMVLMPWPQETYDLSGVLTVEAPGYQTYEGPTTEGKDGKPGPKVMLTPLP